MNWLRLWLAIMGALQTVSGGLGALGILPGKVVGLIVLMVAGLHVGTVMYVTPSPFDPSPALTPATGAVVNINPVIPAQTTPPES